MKSYRKKLIGVLCALTAVFGSVAFALHTPTAKTSAETAVLSWDFTDTMDGADFAAPASNYGWKVTKGALAPDNSITPNKQIGYLEQAIALNVPKYISMDFYAQTSSFDVALVPCAETLDPWATGIGVHSNDSGWMTLNTNIDLGPGWLADYTGIGNGVDGYAHKLEITSDGTNLTFKVDGMDAFTSVTVAIPADSVQLFLRAEEGSYIDNLYIGAEKPVETETATYVDFTDKTDLNDFTSMALSGWTGGNGKYHPVDEGAWSNASAAKLNEVLDLTGTKYISFDFYATEASFDVGLLDTNATNIWGNALYIHVPYRDGQTIGIDNNVDSSGTSYQYYDGVSIGCIDGKAHTLEIFVNNGKVSYALDGTALVGNGGTTEYDVPADNAYLVFRAVGTASYIDNLYVADSAPAASVDYDFDSVKDGLEFANWNSAGWSAQNGGFAVNADWASTQLNTALDLTKNQEITFDVFLSSADTNKQFNVAFVSEENLATATTEGAGVGFSLGSTLWLGTNLGRAGWIADAAANLYNDTWHSVKISVTDGKISIAVDGVAYDALTADIPASTAYMLLQSTSSENVLDNLKITQFVEINPYDGVFEHYGSAADWTYANEKFAPEAAWASIATVEQIDLTKNQEIAFDVYLSSADADKQFNVGFFETKVEATNVNAGSGLAFSFGSTVWVSTNFGRNGWAGECEKDYFDNSLHSVKLTVISKEITVTVDDEVLYFLTNGVEYTPTLTVDAAYLLMQGTSAETYIQNYAVTEIVLPPAVYTVTFQNWDGTVLQSIEVEEGATPVYTGETPTRDADEDYTYTFKGWDQEIVAATGDTVYVAQFDATEIIEYLGELNLDFSDAAQSDVFTALALDGWTVSDGKYAPAQAGARNNASSVRTALPIDMTGTKYISVDFYSTAETFEIGFLDMSAENMWGNGLFIHLPYTGGTTIGVDTYVDCGGTYLGGLTTNVMDGKVHNLLMTVSGGKVSYALDGIQLDITADVPSDAAYLFFRAVGTESYIDNLIVSETETMLGELSLDFTESVSSKVFTPFYNNGWTANEGKYFPCGVDSTVQSAYKMDLTKNWDVRFDVCLTGAFHIGFFADITINEVGAGKSFAFGDTLWLGSQFGRNAWLADVGVNLIDGNVHTVRITVIDGYISIAVDGISYRYALNTAVPADAAYLLMQAGATDTYVDNFSVSEIAAYTLTVKDIAGETLESVNTTGYYKLPERGNEGTKQCIGYVYNGRVYRATNEISVEENAELIAMYIDFTMTDGASIRLDAPTGMRFTSKLDETAYAYLQSLGVAQIGTLIAKAEDVVDGSDYSKLYYNNEYTHLNIVNKVGKAVDGYYVYNGVIAEVKTNHYEWQFASRGYIKITYFDGYELAFYTNGISRAVKEVAQNAYYDRNLTLVEEGEELYPYLTEDGDYSPYTEAQRNILYSFLAGNAVYVSLSGSDENDGSTLTKAVATFERAVELTKESDDALILLCDGEYSVSQTVALGSNVTVKSLHRNGATLSGATVVDKNSIVEKTDATLGRVWEIPYGEKINQLYINDTYGVRARYPDAGQELRLFNADETLRTLSVFSDDINGFTASDLVDSVLVPSVQWAESYVRVAGVTEKTLDTGLELTDIRLYDVDNIIFTRNLAISPRTSYHFENSKAFLNARGEWFYDETAKKIYYLPYDGETLTNTTVRIPVTQTLVTMTGESGAKVSNVTFDGVNFMYTKNGIIDGKIGGQANRNDAFAYTNIGGMENGRTFAAIEAEFVDGITFTGNVFACMGGGALDFLQGATKVTIENNLFRTVGGNGILVGTLDTDANVMMDAYNADNAVINSKIDTVNNYFTEIGWQEYGSCAVVYTYAANSKIDQNTINNVAYTGISLGWGWEYLTVGAYLENNEITDNRITNVMSFLNDGGVIYLVGGQRNTLVSGNYIANVYNGAYKYPADIRDNDQTEEYWWANAGIYLDTAAGSDSENTKVTVENNYIADDIENQKYEFCNVVNVPNNAAHDAYYFTIDGKTGSELSIQMSNGVTAADVAGAGASGFALIPSETILFGAHMVDEDTLTVYGAGFGESYDGSLTVNGETVSASDVTAWSDGAITFTTSGYAGCSATVQVGNSNRLYTAMNVDVAADLARFDGYIDVENVSTWYTKLDVTKQEIDEVTGSSGESTYAYLTDGLYYTSWEAESTDATPWIEVALATASTVENVILYDRMETNEEDAEYRKNIRVIGLTGAGEVTLYESGENQAYGNFGMLTLNMAALGHGNTVFTGFRIEKTDGVFSIAEIAII